MREYVTTEAERAYRKRYYAKNRDKIVERQRQYNEANREKINDKSREYAFKHDRSEYFREYYRKRKEGVSG